MSVAGRTFQILDFFDRAVGLFCKLIGNTGLDPELDTVREDPLQSIREVWLRLKSSAHLPGKKSH